VTMTHSLVIRSYIVVKLLNRKWIDKGASEEV
jgi:hypothetical protein